MLRKIGLSNFKCWKELDIELAPITLLFGTNSSGKTAILQSLLMLKQTVASRDPGQHLNFGGGPRDYVDLGSYHDLVYQHDTMANIGVGLSWYTNLALLYPRTELKVQEHNFEMIKYEVGWRLDDIIFIDRLRYEAESRESTNQWLELRRVENGHYCLTSSLSNSNGGSQAVSSPQSCYILPRDSDLRLTADSHILNVNLTWQFERTVEGLRYIGPLRLRPQRFYLNTGGKPEDIEPDGANAMEALIASERGDRKLLSSLRKAIKALDLVEDFNVIPLDKNQRLYAAVITQAGVESSLADVGFGVSQVLPVITMLLSAPPKSIILLEQPELHLHPNAQAAMADLLLEVAEKRNLQLIVESHSEHIVRRMQRRIAEASPAFATPENIKMYYCQPGEGGATIDEVAVDRFGQISHWPEKFMGDISGDLHTMLKAALERRSQELESVGIGR